MDEKKLPKKLHNILLENRRKLSVFGVVDVDSFSDEFIIIDTEMGLLVIRGQELKINRLNLESGELLVDGNVIAFEYSEEDSAKAKNNGFWSKIFK